jgi:hypothetical protein
MTRSRRHSLNKAIWINAKELYVHACKESNNVLSSRIVGTRCRPLLQVACVGLWTSCPKMTLLFGWIVVPDVFRSPRPPPARPIADLRGTVLMLTTTSRSPSLYGKLERLPRCVRDGCLCVDHFACGVEVGLWVCNDRHEVGARGPQHNCPFSAAQGSEHPLQSSGRVDEAGT